MWAVEPDEDIPDIFCFAMIRKAVVFLKESQHIRRQIVFAAGVKISPRATALQRILCFPYWVAFTTIAFEAP